jgi:hypothetical protein
MGADRKIFHTRFARVSPVFAALSLLPVVLFAAFSTAPVEAASTASTTVKRQAASAQFARAEDQRATLNERASNKRTLAEYKQVVSTYRRVVLITPHAPEVPEAVLAVAELYTEMGDRFGRSYYQQAVESYRFLIHDYPASRHVQDALLRIAELQKDQLSDPAAAAKTYDEGARGARGTRTAAGWRFTATGKVDFVERCCREIVACEVRRSAGNCSWHPRRCSRAICRTFARYAARATDQHQRIGRIDAGDHRH